MPAKFNFLVAASIPAVALVPLLACGGDSKAKTDSGIIVHDSSGSGSGSAATCTFGSNYTPTVTASATNYQPAGSGTNAIVENELRFRGLVGGTQGSADQKEIRVLLFGGCGTTGTGCAGGSAANATPDWPVAFAPKSNLDLAATVGSGSNATLAHPDVLVLLLADPDTTKYNTLYIAVGGVVNVTAAADGSGHPFAGNATNLDFLHIDSSFNPAADGCESIVPSFTWSGSAFTAKDLSGGPEIDAATIDYLRHRMQ